MNERLKFIYNLIVTGKGVLDVGTDHGYIPIELASSGYNGTIIASDINEMPLEIAKKNALNSCVYDRISFILTDGIEPSCLESVDTVIIAGMGGDTICHILDEAYNNISKEHVFLLQPMSKPEILRYWLINNGFSINGEYSIYDNERLYCVLTVSYTGVNSSLSDSELFTGSNLLIRNSEYYMDILDVYITKFERIFAGSNGKYTLCGSILNQLKDLRKCKDDS